MFRYGDSTILKGQSIVYQRETPESMILQLIVAEEVPSRSIDGTYEQLWNPDITLVGIGSCLHTTKVNMTVMHFSEMFSPNSYA